MRNFFIEKQQIKYFKLKGIIFPRKLNISSTEGYKILKQKIVSWELK